jgi:ABC-type xylose transport system permease subunit
LALLNATSGCSGVDNHNIVLFLLLLLVMCNDACGVPLTLMLQLVVVLVMLFIPHTILFNVFAHGDHTPLPPLWYWSFTFAFV